MPSTYVQRTASQPTFIQPGRGGGSVVCDVAEKAQSFVGLRTTAGVV